MEPVSQNKLLYRQYKINETPYFLHFDETANLDFHPFLGYPMVPIIGRYGNAGYELNQTLFVTDMPCLIQNNKSTCFGQSINLPKKIIQILQTIPQSIPHNKPPKKLEKQKKQKGEDQDTGTQDFHPIHFPILNNFRFRFIISNDLVTNKKNQFLNYVNHSYIFKQFDFSVSKKLVQYLPLCLVEPQEEGSSGIYKWVRDYKSINFDHIRSQYLSFHLKKGAPAFSPNNLKFGLKQKRQYIHFFTVVLCQDQYYVNYHWHILNKQRSKQIQSYLNKSHSLKEFIEIYKSDRVDCLIRTFQSLFN